MTTEIDPNPKVVDEGYTDEEIMMEMPLDAIVQELRRRSCPMIYANSLGMMGRVVFIPASLEVLRAQRERSFKRQEVRKRTTPFFAAAETSMGVSDNGQSVHHLHIEGSTTGEERKPSGLGSLILESQRAARMQRGSGSGDSVQPSERSSTEGTSGV